MPRPIDPAREEARQRGEKRYIAARLCPLGHRERFVVSPSCCICLEIRQAERIAAKPKCVGVERPKRVYAPRVKQPSPMALARAAGEATYIGTPCALGHTKRLTT